MQKIAIFPGRFNPPHRGHLKAFEVAKNLVGANNAYVATSNKIDPVKSPLTFAEKQQFWAHHGVPVDKIVKVVNPYKSEEITHKFDPKNTAIIFFLSKKDADRLSFVKKDSTPAYFQPYQGNENNLAPFEEHAYVSVVPTFDIDGKAISGTNVREVMGSSKYTEEQKKRFFQWVFGWFDLALFELLVSKFTEAENNRKGTLAEGMRKFVKLILRELMFPEPDGDASDEVSDQEDDDTKSPAEKAELDQAEKEKVRAQRDALKKKQQFQIIQKKYREQGVKQDKRDIDATKKELDNLRKGI